MLYIPHGLQLVCKLEMLAALPLMTMCGLPVLQVGPSFSVFYGKAR